MMSIKLYVALAASLVLLAHAAPGAIRPIVGPAGPIGGFPAITIGDMTYKLMLNPMDFNTLATTTTGCPSGSVFSGFDDEDGVAAVLLADDLAIWVNQDTMGGKVPTKLVNATELSYADNQDLMRRPYICKGSFDLKPAPAPIIINGTVYVLIKSHAMDFDTLKTTNGAKGCPEGTVFSGWNGTDADAARALARNTTIWVNANTVGGKVPVKAAGSLVLSWVDNTPLTLRPFICKAVLSPEDPIDPVEPVVPVDPVGPIKPVDPVGPIKPVVPVVPVEPVKPVGPVIRPNQGVGRKILL